MPLDVIPHRPILGTRTFTWRDEADCETFARRLSQQPGVRDATLELHGGLGAGKTTFARHLLRALGVQGRIKSPTFAVMESYDLPQGPVAHFDFYRFGDAREFEDAGFREVFSSPGLKLSEWPERVAAALPAPDLRLSIEALDEQRREVRVQAFTPRGAQWLEAWA